MLKGSVVMMRVNYNKELCRMYVKGMLEIKTVFWCSVGGVMGCQCGFPLGVVGTSLNGLYVGE